MATTLASIPGAAAGASDEIRPADFALEIARGGVAGVAVLAAGTALLAVTIWNPVPAEAFWLVVALAGASVVAWRALAVGPMAAAALLTGGLGAIVIGGSMVGGASWLLPWSSLAVLVGAAVGGWRLGLVAAAALTVAVGIRVGTAADPGPVELLLSAGGLTWSSLFLYWLISRPTRTALGWALHSHHESLARTVEARARQAELARLSKSLGEYAYRLEQLNLDLARARRTANEARRLKEQFAAAVSHELRTPLNLILGFSEMMVLAPSTAYGQSLPPSYRADLQAMYRNAMHISSLVDDILDLSQIDAGRMALHREWAALRDVVQEAVVTVETLFTNRQLTLRNLVPADLPELYLDRTRIRQILINLLGNAARFLQRGGATVSASACESTIVLAVRDSGPGIPPEDLPYVFEEFRQSTAASTGHGGSGLGLAVSRRFAEMHGGAMRVESTLGEGTTFLLELPIAQPAASIVPAGESWDDRAARRVRGRAVPRIAVFDQHGQVRRVFQRHLDHYDMIDERAVAAAVRRGVEMPLHAVVLGGPEGAARWRQLVQRAPQLRGVPMLSCPLRTAHRTAAELGAHVCLTKPIARGQLRAALRRLDRPVHRVVVVDDNVEMTRLLARMLRSLSHAAVVEIAHDGTEGLALVRATRPDVVLLDLLMPRTDGYAVLEALAADPALRDIPVILITARGTHSEAIVADHLTIERIDGLSVGELMVWIRSGLDALLGPRDSDPAPEGARPG